MTLQEMLKMCADEQQVLVIVQKDFPKPAVRGDAETLGRYLCPDMLKGQVCGIGTDDGDLLKIWVDAPEGDS